MKKKFLTLIIGIMLFIPITKAANITSKQYFELLKNNVEEINSNKDELNGFLGILGGALNEETEDTIELKNIEITIENNQAKMKSGEYTTTIDFNEQEQKITITYNDIDEDNINGVFNFIIHRAVAITTAYELKGYDAHMIESLNNETGITEDDTSTIIDLNKINIPKSKTTPTLIIKKIDDTKYKLSVELEDSVGTEMIDIYKSEDGQKYEFLMGLSTGVTTTIEVPKDKEYKYKAVVKGYSNFGEVVSTKDAIKEETKPATTTTEPEKPTTTPEAPATTTATKPTTTPETEKPATTKPEESKQDPTKDKVTSETVKNPETGINVYSTIFLISIIVVSSTYIIYKRKNRINKI